MTWNKKNKENEDGNVSETDQEDEDELYKDEEGDKDNFGLDMGDKEFMYDSSSDELVGFVEPCN